MHIPDGLLSGPVNVAGGAAALAGCAAAAARLRGRLADRQGPLLGVTAAFVFAAQMLNFPVGFRVSGHFLGAMLAAVLLGPAASLLVMAAVLIIQCLLFADGGVTALGSNLVNMGLIGGVGGWLLLKGLLAVLPRTRGGFLAAVAVASWASVMAASAACAAEVGASGVISLRLFLPPMLAVHAVIGAGEAIITVAAVSTVLAARADLVDAWPGPGRPLIEEARP